MPMSKVTIIDYGSGNLHSIAKAFERQNAAQNFHIVVSNQIKDIEQASHIVLPGVGAFADCMHGLLSLPKMVDAMKEAVLNQKKPFLGVCVGMQMLAEEGHEHGVCKGLGWIEGTVEKIQYDNPNLKIPHMGWNDLTLLREHPLTAHIENGDHAYFVHSYHMHCRNKQDVLATTHYGNDLTAIVAKDNIMGTQFHPEKSQGLGLELLSAFMKLAS